MDNRLLLVDDEKKFLESVKEGLDALSDIFKTDICYSVSDAIKKIQAVHYDLVITDIRMPKKNGIDLLIHLRKINYSGKVMVMSAYIKDENIDSIKSMGAINIISKPFKMKWFKSMLLEFFNKENEDNVVFESIDLLTVMQVINLEKKTTAIQIKSGDKKGFVHFQNGEIINSEFGGRSGQEALLQMISNNEGSISIKKTKGKIKNTINMPFGELMMEIMKTIDELRKKTGGGPGVSDTATDQDIKKANDINNKKEEKMAKLENVLQPIKESISALNAAMIFGRDGIPIASENPGNEDIDAISAKFAMVNVLIGKSVMELSGGGTTEIIVEEEKGWILLRPIGDSGTVLCVSVGPDATLGNLRLVAKKVAAEAALLV